MRLHLDSTISGTAETTQSAQTGSTAQRSGGRAGEGSLGSDSISVSGLSSALNEISAQRGSRIAQLTSAVQSGQYQVSSAALSGAIVGHAVS